MGIGHLELLLGVPRLHLPAVDDTVVGGRVVAGGLTGFDWVILALGVFLDIASYGASEYGRRERYAAV